MPQRYKRHFLRAKEAKSILRNTSERLKAYLEQVFSHKVEMERVETGFCELFLVKDRPLLVKIKGRIFPTLIFDELLLLLPKVIVDMGAVPYVCNGADIMAPGIVGFEGEFGMGNLVRIVDENHGKTIAIGTANYDVEAAKEAKQGVVVKNIHFAGDKIWNLVRKSESLKAGKK